MLRKQIENTIPVLAVSDLERSVEFFRRILDFELEWNASSICSVGRDGHSIMLKVQEQPIPSTVWIGLETDELFERVQQSEAKIVQAPTHNPWAYEMKFFDPDGNTIWLGTDPNTE